MPKQNSGDCIECKKPYSAHYHGLCLPCWAKKKKQEKKASRKNNWIKAATDEEFIEVIMNSETRVEAAKKLDILPDSVSARVQRLGIIAPWAHRTLGYRKKPRPQKDWSKIARERNRRIQAQLADERAEKLKKQIKEIVRETVADATLRESLIEKIEEAAY